MLLTDPLHIARFWSKVEVRRSSICWEWRAAKHEHGYGIFRSPTGAGTVRAHRVAWALANAAEVDAATTINHTCDNPGCCNPGHLYAGTQAENIADMHRRRRRRYAIRFSQSDRDEILRRYRGGETQKVLAAEYGCAQSLISMIVSGDRGASVKKGISYVAR